MLVFSGRAEPGWGWWDPSTLIRKALLQMHLLLMALDCCWICVKTIPHCNSFYSYLRENLNVCLNRAGCFVFFKFLFDQEVVKIYILILTPWSRSVYSDFGLKVNPNREIYSKTKKTTNLKARYSGTAPGWRRPARQPLLQEACRAAAAAAAAGGARGGGRPPSPQQRPELCAGKVRRAWGGPAQAGRQRVPRRAAVYRSAREATRTLENFTPEV